MATQGVGGSCIETCLCEHTKAALSEQCRLHFWAKAVHNFATNAVVRIKQITSRSISQNPSSKMIKTLATRVLSAASDRRNYSRSVCLCSVHFSRMVIWERRVELLCRCLVKFQLADEFFQSGVSPPPPTHPPPSLPLSPSVSLQNNEEVVCPRAHL